MQKLQRDFFPAALKQAANTLLGMPALAAIILKQAPADTIPAILAIEPSPIATILHPHEIAKLDSYRLAKRRTEFLTGRICAKMALQSFWTSRGRCLSPLLSTVEIQGDSSGRPLVCLYSQEGSPQPDVSITHGGEYAAALAADTPCGIDIQPHKENLLRVREKYCSLEEMQLLAELLPNVSLLPQLSLLWAAKEAAKKALSYRQMPGFLELVLTRPAKTYHDCHSFTLAVMVQNNPLMPDAVTVLATLFKNYGLAICILAKEQHFA
ncbi:MAG: 4'-phosphopantetheinyl transferase superfamily protein [Proteobacteria bacterium]|nr:4'-phosphopantetheinyl transferase superfamily protein [Pseudomonadota bacterium]